MKFEMFKELPASQNGISNRAGLALMTMILLLAFALGADGLNADVIWLDELYSITILGAFDLPQSPAQIIDLMVKYNLWDHVPLYFILGAGWASVTGWSQFSLRLLSLFFGVLMVAWLYRFTLDAVNRRTAVVAACLMATSAFMIWYFHEIRMYSLLMLLAVMHSWFYWRLARGFRSTWLITEILFILTCSALLYTHYLSLLLFAGLGVYHLIFVSKTRRWLKIILGWGIGALLFLPYASSLTELVSGSSDRILVLLSPELTGAFAYLLVSGFNLLWLPLALLFGYALWRKQNPAILWLLVVAFVMLLTANWQLEFSLDRMRYLLILWFPFVILFAYALASFPHWPIIAAFIIVWGIAGFQFSRSADILTYTGWAYRVQMYPPLHEYVYHLQDKTRYQDYLIGFSEEIKVNRVQSRHSAYSFADYYLDVQLGIDGVFVGADHGRYRLESDVETALDEHPYILFAYDPENKPPNFDEAFGIIRQEDYIPCTVIVDNPDLLIQRYVHSVMDCDHEPAPIAYENGIKVIDRAARYVPESDLVQILTWWEIADENLLDKYNVSMQIITPDWRNMRQEDRHLYELPPWDVIELSTVDLPPGDYRVMAIVYDRETNEKVSGADPTSGESANIFPIATFTIPGES